MLSRTPYTCPVAFDPTGQGLSRDTCRSAFPRYRQFKFDTLLTERVSLTATPLLTDVTYRSDIP